MRTKKATKHNTQSDHTQFGIYNWFALKGVTDKEIIKETIHNFCQENGFYMEGFSFTKGKEIEICNWVAGRFVKFAVYAGNFLKDNNYIPHTHAK
jgi:hypothetical protein